METKKMSFRVYVAQKAKEELVTFLEEEEISFKESDGERTFRLDISPNELQFPKLKEKCKKLGRSLFENPT